MTDMDKSVPSLSPHGVLITDAPSAGTTTLLRHCLAGLIIGQSGTDSVMPLRFQAPAGVQS